MFNILSLELIGSKPDIKFCLIKLYINYDFTRPINLKIKDIAKTLGVPLALIRITFSYLEQNSLLEIKNLSTPKGAARKSYKFLGVLSIKMSEQAGLSLWNKKQLELMLSIFTADTVLSRPAKVLYSILLMNSSEVGIVEKVSYIELIDLLNASKSSVRRYIKELLRSKYLRNIASGKGNSLFGVNPSIYYLNLTHSSLSSNEGYISTSIFAVNDKPELEAETICRIASLLSSWMKKKGGIAPKIERLLLKQQMSILYHSRLMGGWKGDLAITEAEEPLLNQISELKELFANSRLTASYLQATIEIFASKILVYSWEHFEINGREEPPVANNDEHIDFIYSLQLLNDEEINIKAVKFIYSVAYYLAWSIFVEIIKTKEKEFKPSHDTHFLVRVIKGNHQSLVVQFVNYSKISNEFVCYV